MYLAATCDFSVVRITKGFIGALFNINVNILIHKTTDTEIKHFISGKKCFFSINMTTSKTIIHGYYFTVLSNIFATLGHVELIDANTVCNQNARLFVE